MMHVPGLYITESEGRGRGVFTLHPLQKGDIIELCPVLIIPPKDYKLIDQTSLFDYYFISPKPHPQRCFVLGYGSIYNHSYTPNAEIVFDIDNQKIEIHCTRMIEKCSEIFIDYTGGLKDAPKLWFENVEESEIFTGEK
ncbi:MAG: SET domain-containing protein-lysine N-methyltransferase [Chitinophagales bacterium]